MSAPRSILPSPRTAFTLFELMVVLVIISILAGMAMMGMGNILYQARVQRSVYALVQTTTLAKQLAMANRRVYTITFNSSKPPGNTPPQVPLSFTTDLKDFADTDSTFNGAGAAALRHSMTAPAPSWSDKPEDQWYALMGPWQDANGRWWQVRGGMPLRERGTAKRMGNEQITDAGAASSFSGQLGGCYGPPSTDPLVPLPGTSNAWDLGKGYTTVRIVQPANWTTAWRWDPYEVQVGPRRFLERGTRWVAMFDCPEWAAQGSPAGDPLTSNQRSAGTLTACFAWATPAHLMTGRSNGANEWAQTTSFNFYPSGLIDRNQCANAEAYSRAGQNFDQRVMGYVGICSNRTAPATFQPYKDSDGTDDTSKPLLAYKRPVAMTWITLFASGQVVIGTAPRQMP